MLDNKQKKYQFSPELAALLESQMAQGRVARSDVTKVNNNTSTTIEVKRKLKKANQRIANQHASKVVSERDANRRALKLNIDRNKDNGQDVGTITDAHQAKIDKAFSDYGLSNALGQMTNVSDVWRATPSFGRFMGKDVPMSMVMAGQAVTNPIGFAGAMGAGYLGSELGARVGEYYGNEELGRTVGSLVTMPFGYKAATSNATKNFILSRAINQAIKNGVKETPTFLPTIFDMTKPLNWDRNMWNTQYFNAIKRGNMAELLRLRDLRFQQASGNNAEVFAHTTHAKFNNFDKSHFGETDDGVNGKGFYFSTTRPSNNPNIPTSIKGPHGEIYTMNYGPNKMYVYLKGNKEFNVGNSERNFFNEPNTIGVVGEYLYKNNKPTEIIVGNPNNIKSANAIVRDDSGNIVPLYDRDNFLVDDIRGLVHNTYNHPGVFVNLEETFTPVTRQFVHPSEAVRKAYTAPNLERLDVTTAEPLMSASKRATGVSITRKPVGTNLNNNTNVNVLSKQYTSPIIEVRPIRQNVGNGRERIDTNIIENQVRSRLGRELNDLGPVEEETLLGSAEDLTPYTVNGDKAGGEANFYEWDYVRNNLNRKANLDNRTKEGLMTRDLSKGEVPYELEDLVENGRLKDNTALEETYSGTRGSENFFDRGDDDVTRMTKYLRTKYGVKDRKSLGNVGEDNSKNRSGVIMTNDGWLYSIDSFSPALKRLYRALKSGRRFKLLDTNKLYVRANDFGLLNRYTEHYNPDFSDLFINSKGNIPEGAKVIRVGDKYFFLNKEGRVMGSIRERTPEQIINERLPGSNQKSPNEWIKLINEEFKLNIPLARVNPKGQIEWPNLYGVLYKKGGSITS